MSEIHIGYLLFILFLCLFASAFFSASETAMMSANRYKLKHLAKNGNKNAVRAEKLLDETEKLLGTILLGNNFVNILATSVGTLIGIKFFGEAGVVFVTIILTIIVLLFSELAPKTLAAKYAEKLSLFFAPFLQIAVFILYPLVALSNKTVNFLLKPFKVNIQANDKDKVNLSNEELKTVVISASDDKEESTENQKNMLIGVLELKDVTVEEVMVPRNEIIGIDLNDSWEENLDKIRNCHHSRMPVFRDSLDQIEGVLYLRDIFTLYLNKNSDDDFNSATLLKIIHPCSFMPDTTPLTVQLTNFRREKRRSGLVVDEYGEIRGMVTLEDIMSYIIGNFDNFDGTEEEPEIIKTEVDGVYKVSGGISLRVLNRELDLNLPIEDVNTLSGLIIETLENFPQQGTELMLSGVKIKVLEFAHGVVELAEINLNTLEENNPSN